MAFALVLVQTGNGGDVEFALDQALHEAQRQRLVAGIVRVALLLEAAHLRAVVPLFRPIEFSGAAAARVANGAAVIDADRRHVPVLEKLVLVLADAISVLRRRIASCTALNRPVIASSVTSACACAGACARTSA